MIVVLLIDVQLRNGSCVYVTQEGLVWSQTEPHCQVAKKNLRMVFLSVFYAIYLDSSLTEISNGRSIRYKTPLLLFRTESHADCTVRQKRALSNHVDLRAGPYDKAVWDK